MPSRSFGQHSLVTAAADNARAIEVLNSARANLRETPR
jgi:hypothetical protein